MDLFPTVIEQAVRPNRWNSMSKRLKLMAEYAADVPLWWEGADDAGLANPLTLDLPQELIQSLRAWNVRYETQLDMVNPHESVPMTPAALADFDREGQRLWQALRDYFGDRVTVTYFSPIQRREIEL